AISYNTSQMVILTFINTMGITVITTKSYLNIITWLSYLFASAVSQANQIRVAYLIGAGDEDEADRKVRETLKLANLVTLVVASLVYIFSDELFGIFTQNPEILKLGKTILLIDIILEIARTGVLVLIRGMQGAGDIKYPIFIGIASMWSVATLFSYIFGIKLGWGLQGVWIAMLADECLRATIFWFRWKSGKWRARKII
ncbi:MAG: MATE family efflux transporter, partial [Clostridium sp.]